MRRLLFLGLAGLLFAACSPAAAVKQFTKGEELAYYDFTSAATFEEGTYSDGEVRLQIKDGVYTMALAEGDNEMWYGQWGDTLTDVVIDVEARQFTESPNTTYGVMCRVRGMVGQSVDSDPVLEAIAAEVSDLSALVASADETAEPTEEATEAATVEASAEATDEATLEPTDEATVEAEATDESTPEADMTAEATAEAGTTQLNANNGDGYLFLVQGSGRFAIMRSRGRSITPLVDWTDSSLINTGAAENRIRAVCVGDYLALYVNGEFVGDATDDTYTSGQVGLVGASANRLGLQVQFDNLSVSAAIPE